jgi:hypothetical protein
LKSIVANTPLPVTEKIGRMQVFSRINDVPDVFLQGLSETDRIHQQPEYLHVVENLHQSALDTYYVTYCLNDKPGGILYFQAVDFKGDDLTAYLPEGSARCPSRNWFQNGVNQLMRRAFSLLKFKLLVSGNIFITGDHGLYAFDRKSRINPLRLLQQAANQIQQENRDIRSVMLSDIYEDEIEQEEEVLREGRYSKVLFEPDMKLQTDPSWQHFSDYLASLSSKYRVRTKKAISTARALERVNMDTEMLHKHQDRMHELYLQVVDQADMNLAILHPSYFLKVKEIFGDRFRVTGFFKDDLLVGFISAFNNPQLTSVHFMGIDYAYNRPYKMYQCMLYQMIDLGIQWQSDIVHFGRTAQEIKSTVGAQPFPIYGYIKHVNRFSNAFIRPFTSHLKPKEYVIRNPFKSKTVLQ